MIDYSEWVAMFEHGQVIDACVRTSKILLDEIYASGLPLFDHFDQCEDILRLIEDRDLEKFRELEIEFYAECSVIVNYVNNMHNSTYFSAQMGLSIVSVGEMFDKTVYGFGREFENYIRLNTIIINGMSRTPLFDNAGDHRLENLLTASMLEII